MAKKNFDVALKKEELVGLNCKLPTGYVSLMSLLGSLPKYAGDDEAKEAGLKTCNVYIKTSTGAITVIQ